MTNKHWTEWLEQLRKDNRRVLLEIKTRKDLQSSILFFKPSLDRSLWPYPGVSREQIENLLCDLQNADTHIAANKHSPDTQFCLHWGIHIKPVLHMAKEIKVLCEVASGERNVL